MLFMKSPFWSDLKCSLNQHSNHSKSSKEQHESVDDMNGAGNLCGKGTAVIYSLNAGEAAGNPLGLVQHPSSSEMNQSGQGGQMRPVGQPGYVYCQELYRKILNKGWKESKLYWNPKSAMQAKWKYVLEGFCHFYMLFVLPWTGPNLKLDESVTEKGEKRRESRV